MAPSSMRKVFCAISPLNGITSNPTPIFLFLQINIAVMLQTPNNAIAQAMVLKVVGCGGAAVAFYAFSSDKGQTLSR